jgi:eukaryotic-like serine/threonine-protein kinase
MAGTTVTDDEEGRGFYQRRLSLAALCMFLLAGGSWTALALVHFTVNRGRTEGYDPLSGAGLAHLAGALVSGALWLATRRGRRRPGTLHALDLGMSSALICTFVVGGTAQPNPLVAGFVTLLCFNTVMLARAIVVPSTARRTLILGLVGAVPVVASIAWRAAASQGSVASAVAAVCWTSVGVVLGTVASRTIFGLRGEVARARVLGQYTLEAKIGEGGMGEVWRASHALLRRPTAIKLLRPEQTGEAAIRRFEREVQITARLTHPSTVAIYDYGRSREGIFYYAMELLEGTDLERLVAEHGPQPPARVVHVLAQVCGALAEAHQRHLVHRDIKPANVILLPREGEPELAKVVDFGLVKDVQGSPAEATRADGHGQPRREVDAAAGAPDDDDANVITGTPLYLSPEAIREPGAVQPSSDIYALGAVGWFLLVGRPVFQGRSLVEVCSKHLHAVPPRPSQVLERALPADLEDLLLACLAKQPEQRPAGARDLRRRLQACSVAGQWTAEQAERWWALRSQRPATTTRAPRGPRTLVLEVAGRAP